MITTPQRNIQNHQLPCCKVKGKQPITNKQWDYTTSHSHTLPKLPWDMKLYFPLMSLSLMAPTETETDVTPAESAALAMVHFGWLTFELDDLSVWCLGQPFETHLTGQRQTNTTAAQQEADLLTASVLRRATKVRRLMTHRETHVNKTLAIKNHEDSLTVSMLVI